MEIDLNPAPPLASWWAAVGPPRLVVRAVGWATVRVVGGVVGVLAGWACRRLGWRMLAAGVGDGPLRDRLTADHSGRTATTLGASGMKAGVPVLGAERSYTMAHRSAGWRDSLRRTAARLWAGTLPTTAGGWVGLLLGSVGYLAASFGVYSLTR